MEVIKIIILSQKKIFVLNLVKTVDGLGDKIQSQVGCLNMKIICYEYINRWVRICWFSCWCLLRRTKLCSCVDKDTIKITTSKKVLYLYMNPVYQRL